MRRAIMATKTPRFRPSRRRRSSPFWSGFLLGLTGPGMLLLPLTRSVATAEYASVRSSWEGIGRYLRYGLKEEEASVGEATRKTG